MKMSLRVLGIFLVCVGFLLVQLLMSGCGGFKMQEVHTLLETKNPEAAYAYMAEKGAQGGLNLGRHTKIYERKRISV